MSPCRARRGGAHSRGGWSSRRSGGDSGRSARPPAYTAVRARSYLGVDEAAIGHGLEKRHYLALDRRDFVAVLLRQLLHDGAHGAEAVAALEHVGGRGIEQEAALGIEQHVARGLAVEPETGLGGESGPALRGDQLARAPPGPQPGSM